MMADKRRTNELDQQINENLRRVYTDAAQEPVPDRFAKLLEQLRAAGDEDVSQDTSSGEEK